MSAPDATEAEAPGSEAGDPIAVLAAEVAAAVEEAKREIEVAQESRAQADAAFLTEIDAGIAAGRQSRAEYVEAAVNRRAVLADEARSTIAAMCSRNREQAA